MQFADNADYFTIGYAVGSFQFKQMLDQYGKPVDKTQYVACDYHAFISPIMLSCSKCVVTVLLECISIKYWHNNVDDFSLLFISKVG